MKIIEMIMNLWAKISSIFLVGLTFYMIHLGISFVEMYLENKEFMQLSTTIFFVFAILFSVLFALIFYSPFFYYGWVKKPNNKNMKSFTKLVTILYAFSVLVISPIINGISVTDIFPIFIVMILATPLFYYGWRK